MQQMGQQIGKGVTKDSLLASQSRSSHVHVWCYSHVLSLVLSDMTGVVVESSSLFSLVNDIAVFIQESYQRMKMWDSNTKDTNTRHKWLSPIGDTKDVVGKGHSA